MIAVIFEFKPKPGMFGRYYDLATALREDVERIDGFISVERFESVTEKGKYVSLSFWRDQRAVEAWRKDLAHRAAQGEGRERLFADYRLRVAEVLRDYGPQDRAQAPI
jgi:heme-degrading monooxygenase HmoA